jgi:hypothetical protein
MREVHHLDETGDLPAQIARDFIALRVQHERMIAPADAFPVGVFPEPIANYVSQAAETYNIPMSFLGSAVIGVAAAIAGNRCELEVKAHHRERLIFWMILIGDPGSGKSGAIDLVRRPIDVIQRRYAATHTEELTQWEALPKAEQRTTPKPMMRSAYTANATFEAVVQMVASVPGLAVISDELASWIHGFVRYQSGGSSRPDWLAAWSASVLKSDRKMSGSTYVERHCINVLGGLQPDLLPTLRNENGLNDGSLDRALPAWPMPGVRQWVEADISQATTDRYLACMLALEDIGTSMEPLVVSLGPAAKAVFVDWFNDNHRTNTDGFSMKADRHLNRLALLLHVLRYGRHANRSVDEATMGDAITLFEFYRGEHNRMMAAIGAGLGGRATDAAARLRSRTLRYLDEAGLDGLTRTDLFAKFRGNVKADELTFVLRQLEDDGLASLEVTATGHRPRETWSVTPRRYEETNQTNQTKQLTPAALPPTLAPITSYPRVVARSDGSDEVAF